MRKSKLDFALSQQKDELYAAVDIEGDPRNGYWYVCDECRYTINWKEEKCPNCKRRLNWDE